MLDSLTFFLIRNVIILTFVMFVVFSALSPGLLTKRRVLCFWIIALLANVAWWFVGSENGLAVSITRPVAGIWAIITLVTMLIGIPLVLAKGLLLFSRWFYAKMQAGGATTDKSVDKGRRSFLTSGALLAVSAGISTVGTVQSMRSFELQHEEVAVSGLPKELDGFRIGHITDIHVGNFVDPQELAAAVEALNKADVDLQVMTGDLIDDAKKVEPTFDALEQCTAKHGMLAIIGNHEKWLCLNEVLAQYERRASRGILRLLVDESTVLVHGSTPLRIVGVDYPMVKGGSHALPIAQRDVYMKASAEKAFIDVRKDEMVICLSHHPDFFPFAADRGARLTLAGHTHGGQVALFGRPLLSNFTHMLGWYQRGESHLYVSGGLGQWLPFRLGVPKSVTVVTLRAETI
ncbi:3',5'-cyclic adenosine monophosphate phosphodiesterase CpdA [Sporomusa silvacetica DSM 10669]|uniref:3',5'-cyclic adenosine monophosphate phosphodiesterase CpdA n=1 Tax=Sporomusa silvacetica DSM 10669 TaxID=1123289 RepID=A0ABZ3IQZ6_9FIRM|nr:metallophosphoesterase [Sporomusa silvacetica]OZC17209.1 putative metallophosphoesterase [Sporomusa silvacetica DSM 10669]